MKLLALSGGSTKGAGILGLCEALLKTGKNYDHIIGTSVGAILAVPVAMEKFKVVKEIFLNLELSDFFNTCPVKNNGDINTVPALIQLIKSKYAIGDMSKLKDLISSVIDEDTFYKYVLEDYPTCYVATVDLVTGQHCIINLKKCSYDMYLEYVLASSSIPVFTEPVEINDHIFYDGGIRSHVAAIELLKKYPYTECTVVFARPQDYKLDVAWKPKNIIDILQRTIDIMNIEISKKDENDIIRHCEKNCISCNIYYLPTVLTSLYDTDNKRLKELYKKGYNIAINKKTS